MANETQHTPAPWKVLHTENTNTYVTSERFGAICTIPHNAKHTEEHEANALLIASAPELLEALKVAQKFVNAYDEKIGVHPSVKSQISQAIAKAEGK